MKLCENTFKQFWSDYELGRFEEPESWRAAFFVRLLRRYLTTVAGLDLLSHHRNCGTRRPKNSDSWVPNYEAKESSTNSVEKRKRSSILDFYLHRNDNARRPVSLGFGCQIFCGIQSLSALFESRGAITRT